MQKKGFSRREFLSLAGATSAEQLCSPPASPLPPATDGDVQWMMPPWNR